MDKKLHELFENGRWVGHDELRVTTEYIAADLKPRSGALKVLLINSPIRTWSVPNIEPIGLCYIASAAIHDGHDVRILDLNALRSGPIDDLSSHVTKHLDKEILEYCPDVIGVGGIITQYGVIRDILKRCRDISSATILLGGGIATCLPEFMMDRLLPDVLVLEEGEIVFSEILDRVEGNKGLEAVNNILYRNDSGEVVRNKPGKALMSGRDGLDYIGWPARHLVDTGVYSKNPVGYLNWDTKWDTGESDSSKKSLSMLATRGCPYSCIYCYSDYLGCGYRRRSPVDVVDEMQYLTKRYDLTYIHFLDELLIGDIKWSFAFFDELERRKESDGFSVLWGGTCRANIIARDIRKSNNEGRNNVFEAGYKVGMRQACLGIESCSDDVLRSIDKSGQTIDDIRLALKESKKVFGYSDPSFMLGSPGETKETVKETIDFCIENDVDVETIFYTTAFPGTKLWSMAVDRGLISKFVVGDSTVKLNDDIIEEYILSLGENSEMVRTNFSDSLTDEELVVLGNYATNVLGSKNKRHPHVGDVELGNKK